MEKIFDEDISELVRYDMAVIFKGSYNSWYDLLTLVGWVFIYYKAVYDIILLESAEMKCNESPEEEN